MLLFIQNSIILFIDGSHGLSSINARRYRMDTKEMDKRTLEDACKRFAEVAKKMARREVVTIAPKGKTLYYVNRSVKNGFAFTMGGN